MRRTKEQAMNTIDALFCDVDDFNKAFYPEWEKCNLKMVKRNDAEKG